MKINSSTIKLEKESYKELENIIKKIASENKINNIKNVEVKLSKDGGVVKFAVYEPKDYDEIQESLNEISEFFQYFVGGSADPYERRIEIDYKPNIDMITSIVDKYGKDKIIEAIDYKIKDYQKTKSEMWGNPGGAESISYYIEDLQYLEQFIEENL